MIKTIRIGLMLATLIFTAQAGAAFALAQAPAGAADVKALDIGAKRKWLRERLLQGVRDNRIRATVRNRLTRMGADELDRLIDMYMQRLALAQANLRQAVETRNLLRNRLYGPGVVGYAPVVTWLPTGTSLNAGGVISPDGRYVRVNANPFFSNVPYFDTFNFATGQTRRYAVNPPRRRPSAVPTNIWHDGLRTRYGPRPSNANRLRR